MSETNQERQVAAAGPAKASSAPARNSKGFRRGLLAKLLNLPTSEWGAGDALDMYQDLRDISELNADVFLEPLHDLRGRRNG